MDQHLGLFPFPNLSKLWNPWVFSKSRNQVSSSRGQERPRLNHHFLESWLSEWCFLSVFFSFSVVIITVYHGDRPSLFSYLAVRYPESISIYNANMGIIIYEHHSIFHVFWVAYRRKPTRQCAFFYVFICDLIKDYGLASIFCWETYLCVLW